MITGTFEKRVSGALIASSKEYAQRIDWQTEDINNIDKLKRVIQGFELKIVS